VAGIRKTTQELTPALALRRSDIRSQPGATTGISASFARVQLSSGAILDVSLETLLSCFGVCVGTAVLVWLPVTIWTERFIGREDFGALFSTAFAQIIPEAIAFTLCSYIVGRRYFDQPAPGLFGLFFRVLPGVLFGLIPLLLIASLAAVCLVIPHFVVMWVVVLVPPILVFETLPRRKGVFFGVWSHALPRALQLARGWGTLGRFLLWFLVARLVFGAMLASVVGAWGFPEVRDALAQAIGTQGDGLQVIFILINAFLAAVTSSMIAAAATVHYFDLRFRKEGFDLELHLRQVERELPQEEAEPAT